jgi:hypothetical protein
MDAEEADEMERTQSSRKLGRRGRIGMCHLMPVPVIDLWILLLAETIKLKVIDHMLSRFPSLYLVPVRIYTA